MTPHAAAKFELLGSNGRGQEFWFQYQPSPPFSYTTPWGDGPHQLLLWDAAFHGTGTGLADSGRIELADQIIAHRCVFAHSAGFDGTGWDDLLDYANIDARERDPSWPFCVTTWDSPKGDSDMMWDAVEFFCAHSVISDQVAEHQQTVGFARKLVVCLGSDAEELARLRRLVMAGMTDTLDEQPDAPPDEL